MSLSIESKIIVEQFTKQDILLVLAIKALAIAAKVDEKEWLSELSKVKEKIEVMKDSNGNDLTYLYPLIDDLMRR